MARFAGCTVLTVFSVAAIFLGCTPDSDSKHTGTGDPPKISTDSKEAAVFLTGNTHSTLQPCGCSADQLGGFDRRVAVISSIRPDRRIVVDTGNMLADTSRQDIIKLQIIFQALSMLRYDVVNLNPDELKLAAEMGLTENTAFGIISSGTKQVDPPVAALWSKRMKLGDSDVAVNIIAAGRELSNLEALTPRLKQNRSVNIAIVDDCSAAFVDAIARLGFVDVIVCPTDSDEPRIVDNGRLGKYFAKLVLSQKVDGGVAVRLDKVAVDNKLPQDIALVDLYKDYQLIVKEEGLLDQVAKVPLPGDLKYLGSENCHTCHGYEYDAWATKRHAHAYQTLAGVGSQYDPECVGCHVVGFGYESGFSSDKSPKDLRDVGCEVCHGPGSDHFAAVTTGRTDKGISDVQTRCNQCHTTERSPGYAGHEEEYLQKIVHWREPKAQNNVKK
jgi:hypothetical protein